MPNKQGNPKPMRRLLPSLFLVVAASSPAQTVSIAEFPLAAGASPRGIAAGPDGAIWFAEGVSNKIGRITTAGAITELPASLANSTPIGTTAGPDGPILVTRAASQRTGAITTAARRHPYTTH